MEVTTLKSNRQNIILELIQSEDIETQNQLLEKLSERGIFSTQATLSRDIKAMRLIKEPGEDGHSRYVKPPEAPHAHDARLQKILRESVLSMDIAQNIIVIKTLSGLASGACSAIDSIHFNGLVGTLAGDDTIFLAMRDDGCARLVLAELRELLR